MTEKRTVLGKLNYYKDTMVPRRIKYILFLVFCWIGLSTAFTYSAELIDKIVAVVNGEIITQRELRQGKFVIDEKWGIQDMIDFYILNQEAKKKGITVNSKVIEEHLSKLEENYSQTELEAILREGNLTLPEYKEWLRKMSLREGLIYRQSVQINEDTTVQNLEIEDFYLKLKRYLDGFSDYEEQVKEFYRAYQKELEEIGKVKIAHFIVKDEAKADEIQQRLEQGEDFAMLMQELPLQESKVYEINLRQIKPFMKEAILSLKTGQVCKIKEKESNSFWIIQLIERKELIFSEYNVRIESYLKNKKSEENLQEWMKKKKEKAEVRII